MIGFDRWTQRKIRQIKEENCEPQHFHEFFRIFFLVFPINMTCFVVIVTQKRSKSSTSYFFKVTILWRLIWKSKTFCFKIFAFLAYFDSFSSIFGCQEFLLRREEFRGKKLMSSRNSGFGRVLNKENKCWGFSRRWNGDENTHILLT